MFRLLVLGDEVFAALVTSDTLGEEVIHWRYHDRFHRGHVNRRSLNSGSSPTGIWLFYALSGVGIYQVTAWIGLFMGLTGGSGAAQLIRSMLYGVHPLDFYVFIIVALLSILVAVFASLDLLDLLDLLGVRRGWIRGSLFERSRIISTNL